MNYRVVPKDTNISLSDKKNESDEELIQLKNTLISIANTMDDSKGYWYLNDLKGLMNWLAQFRTKN